jgi:hypothetical protein
MKGSAMTRHVTPFANLDSGFGAVLHHSLPKATLHGAGPIQSAQRTHLTRKR